MTKTAIRPPQTEAAATAQQAAAAHEDAVRLLSDTPVDGDEQDTLGRAVLAEALAELIDSERTDTPLTIAISAPWGAGKTSTAQLMERRLLRWSAQRLGARPTVVCKFNAWLHSDAAHLGASLAAAVARSVDPHRPWWRRLLWPLPGAMLSPVSRRRRAVVIGVGALVLAAAAMLVGPVRNMVTGTDSTGLTHDDVARLGPLTAAAVAVLLLWRQLFSAAQSAARFIERPAEEASHGEMQEVRAQLGTLVRQAVGDGRLVIFVDDLERCPPEQALQACEVATQLLAQAGVVIVFVADMAAIAKAAGARYPGRGDDAAGAGRRFLEKLVQIQITLPPPRESDLELLLAAQATSTPAAAGEPAVGAPAKESRRRVRRAWRALWRLRARTVAALVILGIVSVGLDPHNGDGTLGNLGVAMIMAAIVLGVASAWNRGRERLRTRRRLREIDAAIATVDLTSDAEALEASVLERVTPTARTRDAGQVPALVRQQVRSYLIHESEPLKEVEAFIRLYAPSLPRGAKRMLNHARVLTRVAEDRGVLAGSDVTPQHLGKWIVLSERWVDLADRVKENPARMAELEAQARDGSLEDGPDHQRLALLLQRPPALGPVVERLIRFEPAAVPAETGTAPASVAPPDGDGRFARQP